VQYKRGVTPREVYERESRAIRFEQYRLMLEQYGSPAVVFGHHQGDLQVGSCFLAQLCMTFS
jgi:hypothetical protein